MTKSLKLHEDLILHASHHSKPISLDIRYVENQIKKPVILFIHGFKGFKDWGHFNLLADEFAKENFVFVKFNLSHNGTTPDDPVDFADLEAFSDNNFSIELNDIGTVIDYLLSSKCIIPSSDMDTDRLFLLGHSRGGGLALLKAGEDVRIKAVATWAAVGDFKRWDQDILYHWKKNKVHYIENSRTNQKMPIKYQLVEDLEQNFDRLHIPNALKKMKIPLLVVHGTEDETISVQEAQLIHEQRPGSILMLIEGGDHVFGGKHPHQDSMLPEETRQALEKTVHFLMLIKS